jgi:hypothetical protein
LNNWNSRSLGSNGCILARIQIHRITGCSITGKQGCKYGTRRGRSFYPELDALS